MAWKAMSKTTTTNRPMPSSNPAPPLATKAITVGGAPHGQDYSGTFRLVVNKNQVFSILVVCSLLFLSLTTSFFLPNQEKNPVVKHIRNVPVAFEAIEPDYLIGKNAFGLFLR